MEFRDYATRETAALVGQLITSHTDTQLRRVREALEAAARAVEAAAAAAPRVDDRVDDLAQKLNAAATAATQKVQQESRKQLEAVHAEVDRLRADLKTAEADLDATIEAHKQVDAERLKAETARAREAKARAAAEEELHALRERLDASRAEAARLSGELESEAAQRAILDADLAAARADRDAVGRDVATMSSHIDALGAELRDVIAARDGAAGERDRLAGERAEIAADRQRLAEERDAIAAERDTLRGDRDAAAAERDALRAQADSAAADRDRLRAQLEAVTAEREALRPQLEGTAAERDALRSQLDAATRERESLRSDRDAVRAERDALQGERDAARAEHAAAMTARDAAAAELARTAGQLGEATARLADVTGQLETARAAAAGFERDQQASQARIRDLESRMATSREHEAALLERAKHADAKTAALGSNTERLADLFDASVRAMDELGAAGTITDLLAALVKQLAAEFPRVALFRVKGNHLEGEHGVGLDATDVTKLVLPLSLDSIITRAVASGTVEQVAGAEIADNPAPFGGTPAVAIALPIAFQQDTLAVIYADSETPGHDAQAAFARLLVRHTTVLLTRLSQELKTLMELREYAVMLLQEAEQMFDADVQAARPEKERRRRLKETIECAHQLYAQRAALEGSSAAGLLDEQIALSLSAEPITPFAKDLAAVTGKTTRGQARQSAAS